MFCYKCGAEIDDDAKFCYKCGASQDLENEPVKMRPTGVAGGTIEGQQNQTKRNDGPDSVYRRPAEEKAVSDPGQKSEDDQDHRKRRIIPIIIIIAVIAAAAVILLLFRDRLGLSPNRSSQTAESAVLNEDGNNGGSAGAAIVESSSDGSSEEEKASAAAESVSASSVEKEEEQTSAQSSEKADEEETDSAGSADKADSTDKVSSYQADSTDKASSAQADSNKESSSGRPKTTGNNTDQMKLPESSTASAGASQTATPTPSAADTAVASVVTASTISTAGYNKAVIQKVAASSELYQPGYDNSAHSAVDGDVITSWQDGVNGYGEGQVIDMTLDKEYKVHCIHFNLGNWRDQQNYNENSRPKQITLYLGNTRHYTVLFPDGMTQYSVMFSADVPASWIRVQIDSVYPGALYDDTCISEITIYASN